MPHRAPPTEITAHTCVVHTRVTTTIFTVVCLGRLVRVCVRTISASRTYIVFVQFSRRKTELRFSFVQTRFEYDANNRESKRAWYRDDKKKKKKTKGRCDSFANAFVSRPHDLSDGKNTFYAPMSPSQSNSRVVQYRSKYRRVPTTVHASRAVGNY